MLRVIAWAALAIVVGVFAPRRRPAALMVFAGLLSVGGLGALILFSNISILFGAMAAAGLLVVFLLARALPRLFVFLLLLVGLALFGFSPLPESRPVAIALLAAAVILSAAVASRADLGMRIGCALLGGRSLAMMFHGEVPPWQRLALAAAVFAIASVIPGRQIEQPAPQLAPTAGMGASLSILIGVFFLGAWTFAPAVPAPQEEPFVSHFARLRREAPRGGLLWALPSEAIFWEDGGSFPRLENLDALWLGAAPRILYKMDGTSLFGRLSLHAVVARLRAIKDAGEQERLRAAAHAIVQAVRDNLRLFRPGARESEIARAILESARRHGCYPESFPPIVAAGPSAAQPHGAGNGGTLRPGELTMTDVGCYSAHYASDFTRTLPVSGKFTATQRGLYQAVYHAQQAAVRACKPGVELKELDTTAREIIRARGLQDHNPFGIGHTVGLFVHDVGGRAPLAPGMVITIEPGLYRKGELGIRIEDTYLVTEKGCEALTEGFPADPDSIERLMSAR
ncbi:MAG: aminopeptidase P family protein [Deltaproteobacteria bacterium]|nr:MAG: aminopeptidase P family protein [Deltaproteobacteria bacterium]